MSTPNPETEIIDLKRLVAKLELEIEYLKSKLKNSDLKIQDLESQIEKSNKLLDVFKKGKYPPFNTKNIKLKGFGCGGSNNMI